MTEARRLLNEEIKAVTLASKGASDDTYYKGRLSGLLWVRDRLLYDHPISSREGELVAALERARGTVMMIDASPAGSLNAQLKAEALATLQDVLE